MRVAVVVLLAVTSLSGCGSAKCGPGTHAEGGACVLDPTDYGGDWAGTVLGFANFSATWQEESYCDGGVTGQISGQTASFTGTCTISWGPAQGAVFDVSIDGTVDKDGVYELLVAFDFDTEERDFADAILEGDADAGILARGTSEYSSTTLGNPVEAEVEVQLEPVL